MYKARNNYAAEITALMLGVMFIAHLSDCTAKQWFVFTAAARLSMADREACHCTLSAYLLLHLNFTGEKFCVPIVWSEGRCWKSEEDM